MEVRDRHDIEHVREEDNQHDRIWGQRLRFNR